MMKAREKEKSEVQLSTICVQLKLTSADGKRGKLKRAKITTARTLRVPDTNSTCTWDRWALIEITDPWNARGLFRRTLTPNESFL